MVLVLIKQLLYPLITVWFLSATWVQPVVAPLPQPPPVISLVYTAPPLVRRQVAQRIEQVSMHEEDTVRMRRRVDVGRTGMSAKLEKKISEGRRRVSTAKLLRLGVSQAMHGLKRVCVVLRQRKP